MEQSVTKRIAKNFSWLMAGNIISGGANFLLIVYVSRVLGVVAFGLWQFAQAFLMYLVLLVDSGFSVFGTREIAKEKNKAGIISLNIFAIRLLIGIIAFIISLAILYSVPISSEIRSLFVFTFLLLFYRALNADWVFQGLGKMEFIALARVLFSVFSFLLIILLVKSSNDLLKVPFVQFALGVLVSIILLWVLFRYFLSVSLSDLIPRYWRGYFLQAIPLCGSIVLMQIYNNLDTIMLGFMKGAAVVGYYTAAYRIFYIFAGIFSLWLATALPVVSKRIHEDKTKTEIFLEKYMRLTMLIIIPTTVFVFFASSLIINLFFGAEYKTASIALMVLIWALLPLAIANIYGLLILIPAGYFKGFFWSVGAGALVNVILNFVLIPTFSYVGAAIATILAQIFAGLVAFFLSRKTLQLALAKHLIKPLAISFVALIFSFAIYFALFSASMFIRQLIGCSVFALICMVVAFLVEREFLLSFVNEIAGIRKNVKSS